MGTFSQRYGYTSTEKSFQRELVSEELRVQLWNVLNICIWEDYEKRSDVRKQIDWLVKRLWFSHLNKDLDHLPSFYHYGKGAYDQLKNHFFNCEWYQLYDFLEFVVGDSTQILDAGQISWLNTTLEKFNAAYRIVDTSVVEITDENEIKSIEEALSHPENPVRVHLNSALSKLSDRENPDYRNSIKESISAVEAACRILTGKKSATLGDALKKVENLHPVMKLAFDKLYGYTSDASGVRHSLIDEASITYADAKFMLVTCSAFVSYLNTSNTLK